MLLCSRECPVLVVEIPPRRFQTGGGVVGRVGGQGWREQQDSVRQREDRTRLRRGSWRCDATTTQHSKVGGKGGGKGEVGKINRKLERGGPSEIVGWLVHLNRWAISTGDGRAWTNPPTKQQAVLRWYIVAIASSMKGGNRRHLGAMPRLSRFLLCRLLCFARHRAGPAHPWPTDDCAVLYVLSLRPWALPLQMPCLALSWVAVLCETGNWSCRFLPSLLRSLVGWCWCWCWAWDWQLACPFLQRLRPRVQGQASKQASKAGPGPAERVPSLGT